MRKPPVLTQISALRRQVSTWRASGGRVALVATMGALHAGHISLVEAARAHASHVVVSIFVNPTQFMPSEDFAAYPRTLAADRELLGDAADIVYAPSADEMYPPDFATTISLAGPASVGLEDRFRAAHFSGVATVVAKLLIQAAPDVSVFGDKDYQQVAVIRRMTSDLDLPVEIIAAPTLREADGLAMSSRNAYLSAEERRIAPLIHQVLSACAVKLRTGARIAEVLELGADSLASAGLALDYLELRDAVSLAPLTLLGAAPARLLVAARLGKTRLIDNIAV